MSQQPPYLRLVEKDEIGDVTETLVGITMGILLAVVCVSIIAFVIAWI